MSSRSLWTAAVLAAAIVAPSAAAPAEENPLKGADPDELPKHRQKQIWDAVPDRRATPKKRRRVLIWVTPLHLGDPHRRWGVPHSSYALKALGEKTGAYESVLSNDLVMMLPDSLEKFDAIVLNNACGRWTMPADKDMKRIKAHIGEQNITKEAVEKAIRKGLLDWVKSGRGIMGFHYAIGGNPKWAEFHEMLGASFAGHPWNEEVGIKVDDRKHPLVAAFGGKDFRIKEETFQYRDPYSRNKLRVLLSLDTKTTNMGVKNISRKDNDFALAWVRSWGKGRIFYTALGHRTELFSNPKILQFYLDGIQFALGDLEAPTAPSKSLDRFAEEEPRAERKAEPADVSTKSPSPSGAAADVRREERAQGILSTARSALRRGQRAAARSFLKKVVADYPGTEAAKEAERLLKR